MRARRLLTGLLAVGVLILGLAAPASAKPQQTKGATCSVTPNPTTTSTYTTAAASGLPASSGMILAISVPNDDFYPFQTQLTSPQGTYGSTFQMPANMNGPAVARWFWYDKHHNEVTYATCNFLIQ